MGKEGEHLVATRCQFCGQNAMQGEEKITVFWWKSLKVAYRVITKKKRFLLLSELGGYTCAWLWLMNCFVRVSLCPYGTGAVMCS